jgi:hypothetical protein
VSLSTQEGGSAGTGTGAGSKRSSLDSSALNMEEEDSDFLSLMKSSVGQADDGADY